MIEPTLTLVLCWTLIAFFIGPALRAAWNVVSLLLWLLVMGGVRIKLFFYPTPTPPINVPRKPEAWELRALEPGKFIYLSERKFVGKMKVRDDTLH